NGGIVIWSVTVPSLGLSNIARISISTIGIIFVLVSFFLYDRAVGGGLGKRTNTHTLLNNVTEKVLYDSAVDCQRHDFEGYDSQVWSNKEQKSIGPKGEGTLSVNVTEHLGGVINIQRKNTVGRYDVSLVRYIVDGIEKPYIPKNELISGKR